MSKDLGAKPLMFPMPVLIIGSYDENGKPDAMNAAWGGIADTNKISLALTYSHKTVKNIIARKAFTVSMATSSYVKECDYFGVASANDVPDKLAKAGMAHRKSEKVDAPIIEGLPLTMECRLISYDVVTEIMIGEIVNVRAEDSILDQSGNVDIEKLDPIIFDTAGKTYRKIGQKVGDAFKDGKSLL